MVKLKILKPVVSVVLFYLWAVPVFAQWETGQINVRFSIPEIAILDIEPELSSVEFEIVPSATPGGKPVVEDISGQSLWINYSSAIRDNGATRSINAQVSQGSVPEGVVFYVEASSHSFSGSANQGVSAGRIAVSYGPKPIITGIGSCYTGDGTNSGHKLTFSVEIGDFAKISAINETEFTILYTITDN